MTAVKHPISLHRVVFTRASVMAVPNFDPTAPDLPVTLPENNLNLIRVEAQHNHFIGTMRTVINPTMDPKYPYSVDMECVAVLKADEELEAAEAEKGCMITAHSVLYGAIRETVAWLSGRQPHGELLLGLSVLGGGQPAQESPATASDQ